MPANRQYKDRLFKFIFGNPENKEWTLSLYNAVNGSSYTNPDDIQLTTIENAVYMSMRNDVSFLIADTMNLYEPICGGKPQLLQIQFQAAKSAYSQVHLFLQRERGQGRQDDSAFVRCV